MIFGAGLAADITTLYGIKGMNKDKACARGHKANEGSIFDKEHANQRVRVGRVIVAHKARASHLRDAAQVKVPEKESTLRDEVPSQYSLTSQLGIQSMGSTDAVCAD